MIHILNKYPDVSKDLKKLIKLDGMSTIIQRKPTLDIVKFDKALADADPEYDNNACTYKALTSISTREYLRLKYGDRAVELINELL